MPTFEVGLSGHMEHRVKRPEGHPPNAEDSLGDPEKGEPERSGTITVEAENAKDAAAFAEQQNPGLKSIGTPKKLGK